MDRTEEYHPEWGNPVTKEHAWYALIDKWILAQKFKIPKIQFTDHVKCKKREDQSVDASVFLRRGNKIFIYYMEIKCGSEGKAIRDCPNWGSIPYSHQTWTLLCILGSACWQKPDMAVLWDALPEPDKKRGRCFQPTIGLSTGSPMEELEKGLKELKGFATHRNNNIWGV